MFDNLHREIKELRGENVELKKSLEFSQYEIDSLKKNVPEVQNMLNNVGTVEQASADLTNRIRLLEDQGKKKNLRITGLPELSSENSEQTQEKVQKLITEKLNLNNVHVKSAYRAGANSMRTSNQPRPIIAKLSSFNEKISCFKASKELKGTNIYLSEDVSKATLDIRKQKLGALKEKRDQGFIAYFSGVEIISKPRNDRRNVGPGTGANIVPLNVSPNLSQPETVAQSIVPIVRGAGTTNSSGASASSSSSNKQLRNGKSRK